MQSNECFKADNLKVSKALLTNPIFIGLVNRTNNSEFSETQILLGLPQMQMHIWINIDKDDYANRKVFIQTKKGLFPKKF